MKLTKLQPISFVAIVVFALAFLMNIQSNVNGGLSLFNQSVADDTGTGDTGGGDFWAEELFFSQACGAYTWKRIDYYSWTNSMSGTVLYINDVVTQGEVMLSGTYSYTVETSGTAAASQRTGWQCPSEPWASCTPCTDPCGSSCSSGA